MDTLKIGKFIALKRKEKNMTQEELARILGVTNKTVSRWENGNYMPDLSLLKPLSEELGITLNELLSGEKIEEQKKIRISVFNTGKQISPDDIGKIWTRFYKADSSRNREDGGSGIGLALVKAIMTNYQNKYLPGAA